MFELSLYSFVIFSLVPKQFPYNVECSCSSHLHFHLSIMFNKLNFLELGKNSVKITGKYKRSSKMMKVIKIRMAPWQLTQSWRVGTDFFMTLRFNQYHISEPILGALECFRTKTSGALPLQNFFKALKWSSPGYASKLSLQGKIFTEAGVELVM